MEQIKTSKYYNECSPKLEPTKFPTVNEFIGNGCKSNASGEEAKHKVEQKLIINDRYQFITNSNVSLNG
jgi:hypothetical protein